MENKDLDHLLLQELHNFLSWKLYSGPVIKQLLIVDVANNILRWLQKEEVRCNAVTITTLRWAQKEEIRCNAVTITTDPDRGDMFIFLDKISDVPYLDAFFNRISQEIAPNHWKFKELSILKLLDYYMGEANIVYRVSHF